MGLVKAAFAMLYVRCSPVNTQPPCTYQPEKFGLVCPVLGSRRLTPYQKFSPSSSSGPQLMAPSRPAAYAEFALMFPLLTQVTFHSRNSGRSEKLTR